MPKKTNTEINGNNYYRITATIGKGADGKPLRKQFYGSSKKEAEAKRDEYMSGINKGLSSNYDKVMFFQVFDIWFEECCRPNVTKSTYIRYEAIVRLHIKPFERLNKKLVELCGLDLQKYYNELYKTRTLSQVEAVHGLLSSFFKYVLKENYIVRNPMLSITLKKEDTVKDEIQVFSKDEVERMAVATASKIGNFIFYFALSTGLRQGELLALLHEDIDIDKKTINVNKSIKKMTYDGERIQVIKTPKTKNSIRIVSINDKLLPLIQRHIILEKQKHLKAGVSFSQQSPFFSSATCGYREAGAVQEGFKRFQSRLNIPYKKFHALRHTFCTLLFESGVPLKTASMLMGHADIATTAQIYTHVDLAEKEKAIDKLSLFL